MSLIEVTRATWALKSELFCRFRTFWAK